MNRITVLLTLLISVIFLQCSSPSGPTGPGAPQPPVELNWSSSIPTISPMILDTLVVEGLGVNDTVYVIGSTTLQSYSKVVRNTSKEDLISDHSIRVTIEQMTLQVGADSIKYVESGAVIYDSVYTLNAPIPAGDSVIFTAVPGVPGSCGLFKVSMLIDEPNTVPELNDSNNLYVDYINIPSQQQFNVTLTGPDPFVLAGRPAAPLAIAHGYEVTSGGASSVIFASFKPTVFPSCGSTATITPTPNVPAPAVGGLVAPPVMGTPPPAYVVGLDASPPRMPTVITLTVATAPQCELAETIFCKGTFVSPDGCVLKQKVAQVVIP